MCCLHIYDSPILRQVIRGKAVVRQGSRGTDLSLLKGTTMREFIRSMCRRTALALAGFGAAALIAACGGGGGGGGGTGTLQVSLTDAPACGYDHVWVDVQKVRIHQSSTASDTDAGWSEIAVNSRIDLLSLTNGVLQTLGQVPLQAGKYQQMRLVLGSNNAVVVTGNGGTETALSTPSGMQSGLKMNVDVDIAADKMADVVLDFDACKSIVHAGNSGNYLLKPVLSVTPHFLSGINGYVDATLALPTTTVSVQQAGVVVKSSAPLSSGQFVLPVASGTYDLVVTSAGHATAVVTGVVVTTDTVTSVSTSSTGINPPTSTTGIAAGAVSTGTSPVDATANVTQALTSGHTIVVASAPVDATTGAYSYSLPTGAPMVASYVAPPATLTFAADSAAAGKYSLAAISGGTTKAAGPITITSGATVTTNFTFP